MASWCSAIIACNEEPFIKYAMDSTYDFVDKMIIVHGSVDGFMAGPDGLSIDKTKEIIENYQDPGNKIIYRELAKAKTKNDLRNEYLSVMPKDIEWVLVQDADEMYAKKQLTILDNIVNNEDDDLACILNGQYWFWGNTNTYCDYDKEALVDKQNKIAAATGDIAVFEDKYGNITVNEEYQERIFRNLSGLNYDKSHTNITDKDGEYLYSQGNYQNRRLYLEDHGVKRYHYSYCRPWKDLFNKFSYYTIRENTEFSEQEVRDKVMQDRYALWLQGRHKEFGTKNPELVIKKFAGDHPECMKDHPFMNKEFGINE